MRLTLLSFAAVLVPLSCSQVDAERGVGAANIGQCPADFCRPGGRCDWGSTCSWIRGVRGCDDVAERDSSECAQAGGTASPGGTSTPGTREPATRVPDAWTCDPSWYNDRRGCDCNCGVLDPDCGIEGQGVYRCGYGQTCDAAGRCAGQMGPSSAAPDGWDCRDDYYDDG